MRRLLYTVINERKITVKDVCSFTVKLTVKCVIYC